MASSVALDSTVPEREGESGLLSPLKIDWAPIGDVATHTASAMPVASASQQFVPIGLRGTN
jgi:hypothetical protein